MAKNNSAASPSEDLRGGPIADLSNAPLPTKATLRSRKALIRQFIKFVSFDLTIMAMVIRGHNPKD